MYYDTKTKKFYDSEFDVCFGDERKTPQVKVKGAFDDVMEVKTDDNNNKNKKNEFDIFE